MYHIVCFEGNASPRALDIVCEHEDAQKHNSADAATDDGMLEQLFWIHLPA